MASNETTPQRPDVADYDDHRSWLRDMIRHLKQTRRGFSYRSFSRQAGFSSPNFLKQVAEGQRNLSVASISKFAKGLGLDEREQGIFEALVLLDQAQSDQERNRHFRRLRRLANRSRVGRLGADQFDVYSDWYHLVVKELVARADFVEDPAWIARRLLPRVRPNTAKRALALLERLELLVRDESGRLRVRERTMSTGPQVRSLAIRNFHRGMLSLAARALDSLPVERRNVTSLTVSLDAQAYQQACELIADVRREILDLSSRSSAADAEGAPADIHQLVFALFPVTREPEKESR